MKKRNSQLKFLIRKKQWNLSWDPLTTKIYWKYDRKVQDYPKEEEYDGRRR